MAVLTEIVREELGILVREREGASKFWVPLLNGMKDHYFVLGFAHHLVTRNLFPNEILRAMYEVDARVFRGENDPEELVRLYARGLAGQNAYRVLNEAMDFCGRWYLDRGNQLRTYAPMLFFGLELLWINKDRFSGDVADQKELQEWIDEVGLNYTVTRHGLPRSMGAGQSFDNLGFLHVVEAPMVIVPSEIEWIADIYGWPKINPDSPDSVETLKTISEKLGSGDFRFMDPQAFLKADITIDFGRYVSQKLEKEDVTREMLESALADYDTGKILKDEAKKRINELLASAIGSEIFRFNGYIGQAMTIRCKARSFLYQRIAGKGATTWEKTEE